MSRNLYEVPEPPSDAISSLAVSPDSRHLLIGSWDKSVYLYDVEQGQQVTAALRLTVAFDGPILAVAFGQSSDVAYVGGIDCEIHQLNTTTGEHSAIGAHDAAISSLVFVPQYNVLVSASWDSSLHIHQLSGPNHRVTGVPLPDKPVALSVSPSKLVVAMASRTNFIFDLGESLGIVSQQPPDAAIDPATFTHVWQTRESSLKFMTRAVACMPSDAGYASSSIEGRVAVEWFDPSEESQARKYAFKCHRQESKSEAGEVVDVVYPVNALAFHPVHGTFASGGGDGVVAIWDALAKRRIKQYPKCASSIAALQFSPDGHFLAIATSPGFEDGNDDVPPGSVTVLIRSMAADDAKTKIPKH